MIADARLMQTEQRCQELGQELFERARAAEPRFWNRAWWEKQMLEYVSADPAVQTQCFRFMEALPRLRGPADIADHLRQYLDPDKMELPFPFRVAVAYRDPNSFYGRQVGAAVKWGAFSMGGLFITGSNTREAIENAEKLRRRNMAFTLDVLGEATISYAQADRAAAVYMELIESLGQAARNWEHVPQVDDGHDGPMSKANISVKLTAFDPNFDPVQPERTYAAVTGRLRPLLLRARELGVFVNVDMESYKYRDLTLDMFMRLMLEPDFRDWSDVGIVVQAYLQDGENDLRRLLDWVDRRGVGVAIRLVKGAYWDSETINGVRNNTRIPVWMEKWQSDACYEKLTRLMLARADRIRPAFASHNVRSLAKVMAVGEELGLTTRDYELQMLAGMGDPLKQAIAGMGRCLRIYCPYGDLIQGMAYLIRRLLENTSNDSFLKQGFSDRSRYRRLLADPASARPPSGPLPRRHYQDTFEDALKMDFRNAVNTGFGSAANREKMQEALKHVRSHLGGNLPLLIDGQAVETGRWFTSTNPAHPQEVIARIAQAGPAQADRAVAAATKAYTRWSRESPFERADVIRRTGELLEERRFELAALLVLEVGKNWQQADAEVTEAVDYCFYHAAQVEALAKRPRRRNVPGEDNVMIYEPCGVAALICSWDFPLALAAGMASAAIVAGNTCVFKPSSHAPVIGARLVEMLRAARLPDGVINYVPGTGPEVGRHIIEHPGVHVAALCGSRETCVSALAAAAHVRPGQRHFKRTILDGGAKNAIIVDHDVDLDEAATGVLESSFAYSGQKCTACSRVIVHSAVYEEFCRKLAAAAEVMTIGDPAESNANIGPVIDAAARQSIAAHVSAARKSARVVFEAAAERLPREGHYVAPIIFVDVDPTSPLAQQEVFGPVLAVLKADDFDHALVLANDTEYALTGGLYSRSPAHIERARWEFRVGNLYINRKITGSQVDVQPYGGGKLSGDGARLGGPDYLLQFTRPRTISENTLRHGLTATAPAEEPAAQH